MVAVQQRLDDVLLTIKNKKVEATDTETRTIPAICSADGTTKRITLDVSPEGKRELEKVDAEYKKRLLEAGALYQRFSDTRVDARASTKPKKASKSEAEAVEDEDEDAKLQREIDQLEADEDATTSGEQTAVGYGSSYGQQ